MPKFSMALHHERGKAGMNLLEVPIMFWPLIELFWVIYFVGGLDFKIQKHKDLLPG